MADIDPARALAALAEKHIAGAAAVALASLPEGALHGVQVPPRLAFAAWTVLREAVPRTGAWPIVVGAEPDLLPDAEEVEPLSTIQANAAGIDLDAWARERVAADPERFAPPSAPWPASVEHTRAFHVLAELGKQTKPALIALVPTTRPHEVPAYLRFGGWNDCPPAEVHVAALRTWNQRFGAEPVVIANDTLELLVRNPVATRDQALELARLQYVYCTDIVGVARRREPREPGSAGARPLGDVGRGVESVEALAARLLVNPRWFFWWD